jgi:chitinase
LKKAEEYDFVNPSHYKKGSKEVWETQVDIWGVEVYIKHCEITAFKYRMRLGDKPYQSVEQDLQKAKWYEDKARELTISK